MPRLPLWLVAAGLILLTAALYWPATRCDFVNLDDNLNVTADAHVVSGLTWESVKWAFLHPMADNWQPLTAWSHMLVCELCGLNPWGHHLANVLLHALNAGLVFVLLQRMTGATWRSLWVAALFAVHPLRVEAVAWVTDRKGVLSAFFGLLSLIAYARYAARARASNQWSVISHQSSVISHPSSGARAPEPRSLITDHRLLFYLLSLCCFALGLMSKPMLVTLPFVMLLLDYWPLGRMQNAAAAKSLHAARSPLDASRSSLLALPVEKIPFFVLAALMSVVTFLVQKRAGVLAAGESLTLGTRVGNALVSYCRYLGKMFWPTDLAVYYPHPGHWPLGKVLLAGGLILGISALLWTQRRRAPYLLMGWLWYCGTLVPVSQVIQTSGQALADRWTYFPSLGVLILIVWGACELTRRWRYQVLALSGAGSAAIVLGLALTRQQIGYWRDSEALFRHAVAVTENNYYVHNDLAAVLYEKGQIDEAISHFRVYVRSRPDLANAHYNLGVALVKKGQIDEAILQLQEAVRLDPADADAHYNLGTVFYQQGRTDEAMNHFREVIRLKPGHAQAHSNLGTVLGLKGETDEAIRQFQEALRLKPDYAEARKNLEVLLAARPQAPPAPGAATNR